MPWLMGTQPNIKGKMKGLIQAWNVQVPLVDRGLACKGLLTLNPSPWTPGYKQGLDKPKVWSLQGPGLSRRVTRAWPLPP